MAQQDKIKREIDRIGLALAKLLSIALNKNSHREDSVKDVMQQTQNELEINLPRFLEMDNNDSVQYLLKEKNFSLNHLRLFANLLYETAGNTEDSAEHSKLKNKALNIYGYIHANANGTLYLDVVYRLKELKEI